jgi:predicted aspartyl protease
MPLLECGPQSAPGVFSPDQLITLGPGAMVQVGPPNPTNPMEHASSVPAIALIDTGATESCIDEQLAISLGLPLIDKIFLGGVAGSAEHNVYLAVITVPGTSLLQYGRFAGVHLAAGSQLHRVLLGRTFLKTSIFIYDGRTGRVTLAC